MPTGSPPPAAMGRSEMEYEVDKPTDARWYSEYREIVDLLPADTRAVIARQMERALEHGVAAGRARHSAAIAGCPA